MRSFIPILLVTLIATFILMDFTEASRAMRSRPNRAPTVNGLRPKMQQDREKRQYYGYYGYGYYGYPYNTTYYYGPYNGTYNGGYYGGYGYGGYY